VRNRQVRDEHHWVVSIGKVCWDWTGDEYGKLDYFRKRGLGLLRLFSWVAGYIRRDTMRPRNSLELPEFILLATQNLNFHCFLSVTICWLQAKKQLLTNWIREVILWKRGSSRNQRKEI
jgi:hypothetical protein